MKKTIFFFIFFSLLVGIAYGYNDGKYGSGDFSEGGFGTANPAPPEPTPSSSSSPSGGSGGVYIPPATDYTLNMIKSYSYKVTIHGEPHQTTLTDLSQPNGTANLLFQSEDINLALKVNQSSYLDYNKDNYYDLEIILKEVYGGNEVATVRFIAVHLPVPVISGGGGQIVLDPKIDNLNIVETSNIISVPTTEPIEPVKVSAEIEPPKTSNQRWFWALVIVVVVVSAIIIYAKKRSKNAQETERKH